MIRSIFSLGSSQLASWILTDKQSVNVRRVIAAVIVGHVQRDTLETPDNPTEHASQVGIYNCWDFITYFQVRYYHRHCFKLVPLLYFEGYVDQILQF